VRLADPAHGSAMPHFLWLRAATNLSKIWSPSGLATWEDAEQNRWLPVPTTIAKGGITALKVVDNGGKPSLQAGWTSSSDLGVPSSPIAVNGVVFALNSGSATLPAALYALDGSTGMEVWNSGKTIESFVKAAGLWSISGQVYYVATHDATIYGYGTSLTARRWAAR